MAALAALAALAAVLAAACGWWITRSITAPLNDAMRIARHRAPTRQLAAATEWETL